MRSIFALLAAGSLAITAVGRLVDLDSAPEANFGTGEGLTAQPLGGNPDVEADRQLLSDAGVQANWQEEPTPIASCSTEYPMAS